MTSSTGKRLLTAGLYGFGDVEVGDTIATGKTIVDEAQIDLFAALTGDSYGIHMEREAAIRHGFTGRVAHGLLVLSLVDGLKFKADAQFKAQASLGWDWKFVAPVVAGDFVSASISVANKRRTRDPRRGILTLDIEVRNQHGTVVQLGENRLMAYI